MASFRSGLLGRLIRFAAVGLLNTLAYFALANILRYGAGLPTAWVSYIAYLILVPVSFIGHKRLTFGTTSRGLEEFAKFVLIQIVNLGIIAATNLALARFDAASWVNFAIVSVTIPAVNFVVLQVWIFGARR